MASSFVSIVDAKADIVQEIMSWLPPKSVIRFKSVCKTWCGLLSTSFFIATHTRRNPHKVSGFLSSTGRLHSTKMYEVSCPLNGSFPEPCTLENYDSNQILQCRKGLLLGTGYDRSEHLWRLWVCNPTTRQHRILPDVEHVDAVLAFDPSKSVNYKVIFVSGQTAGIEVYHSEDDSLETLPVQASWRKMTSSSQWYSCFCNGFVHWYDDDDGSLISFDVEQRRIYEKVIPLPMRKDYDATAVFYESRERPHLFRYKLYPELGRVGVLEVFQMANDHSRWVTLHIVDVRDLLTKVHGPDLQFLLDPSTMFYDVVVMISGNWRFVEGETDEEDKLVFNVESKKMVAYNLRRGTLDLLQRQSHGCEEEEGVPDLWACANTLVVP